MKNSLKNINVFGDFERRSYSPQVYVKTQKGGGLAWDLQQLEAMAEDSDDAMISVNLLKYDDGKALKPGQIAQDIYGRFSYDFPEPTDADYVARLWVCFPLWQLASGEAEDMTKTAESVISECMSHGWGRPYILKTSDIWYLLYKSKIAISQENELLYSKVMGLIIEKCKTNSVRILKTGPHLMLPICGDLSIPRNPAEIDGDMLRTFLTDLHMETITAANWNAYDVKKFWLESWLISRGINYKKVNRHKETLIYTISDSETLYFDEDCKRIGYYNRQSPSDTWEDFRKRNDGGQAEKEWTAAEADMWEQFNRNKPAPDRLRDIYIGEKSDDVREYTHSAQSLKNRDRSPKEYLKTGIKELDESKDGKHHGIPRKGVTILMARTSSGKTALLTEIKAHMMLAQSYRVWEYNAELDSADVADLLERNAVGVDLLKNPAKGIYEVTKQDADTLWDTLDGNYFLYDNRLGMQWQKIEESLIWHCESHRIDCAILDDQIMIDASVVRGVQTNDGESEQVALFRRLHALAQHYNVAVILVCHPRKTTGQQNKKTLVTPEDILGSTKLHALSTMCLCLHRVFDMEDFRERCKNTPDVFLGEDDQIFHSCADSILQISKDRFGGGNQSYMLPLYYEPGTARLKNSKTEHKVYKIFEGRATQIQQPIAFPDVNPFA